MSQNKNAYFQGGGGPNEPTPKKKKYKSDKAIVVQPRFEEPFYRNYDLYDVGGKHSPGTGAYRMDKHKSIKEFIKEKRKKNKDKYKADDQWIEDSNREERVSRMKTRARLLSNLVKVAIDFPIDDQINSTPIDAVSEQYDSYDDAAIIGGRTSKYFSLPDFEGKSSEKLNIGRDYTDRHKSEHDEEVIALLNKFLHKYFSPKETELFSLINGFEPDQEVNVSKKINPMVPEYGTTDSGNTIYTKMWY